MRQVVKRAMGKLNRANRSYTIFVLCAATAIALPAQSLRTLHYFGRGLKGGGSGPYAGVVIGSSGVLYGTTDSGGTGACSGGCGTVYSLTPPTSPGGGWTERVLHSFTGGSDGTSPYAPVTIGGGGALYGTTIIGGSGSCLPFAGCGTVFSLTPPTSPGGAWTESVLYSFKGGSDGAEPHGGVVVGDGGVLYGTTQNGGSSGYGTVFALTPPTSPGGTWSESVLYSFAGGGGPQSGVVIGQGGVLYGTTFSGGTGSCPGAGPGCGTVFSLSPPTSAGGAWTDSVLHSFAGGSDAAEPYAGVVIGIGGVLYGATSAGGTGYGTVFSLTPPASDGGSWTESVLYSFTGGSDGAQPYGDVVIGSNGALFGTAAAGGADPNPYGYGTVFSMSPPTSAGGPWTEATLYSFTGNGGEVPFAGLAIGKGGLLYGTTARGGHDIIGTVFELKP